MQSPHGICPACVLALGRTQDGGARAAPFSATELDGLFPGLEIQEWLGEGGMGWVYKARQKSLDREVALKIMGPETWGDPEFVQCFRREARVLALLKHPNIIQVYEFGEVEGLCYLVMEYAEGPRLDQLVAEGRLNAQKALQFFSQPRSEDGVSEVHGQQRQAEDVLSALKEIGGALLYAHGQGVVHRDIKPANVLLCRDGDKWRLKLIDFGLSFPTDQRPIPYLAGTPVFAAPEQFGRIPGESVGPRADVYGFARTCCCVLLGTPEPTLRDWEKLPRALAKLLARCLSEAPGDRPPDMKTVLENLDRVWDQHFENLEWYGRVASLYFALCGGLLAAAGALFASMPFFLVVSPLLHNFGLTGGTFAVALQTTGLFLCCTIALGVSVLVPMIEFAGPSPLASTSRKPEERTVPVLLGLVLGAVSIGAGMHLFLFGARTATVVGAALGAGILLLPGLGAFLFPFSRSPILNWVNAFFNTKRPLAIDWAFGKRREVLWEYLAISLWCAMVLAGMCLCGRDMLIEGTPQQIVGVPLSIALALGSFLLVCLFFLLKEVTLLLPRKQR
jgi:hypothetical protein